MKDPEMLTLMQQPKIQKAIMEITANPMAMMNYQTDPDVMKVLVVLGRCFGSTLLHTVAIITIPSPYTGHDEGEQLDDAQDCRGTTKSNTAASAVEVPCVCGTQPERVPTHKNLACFVFQFTLSL